MRRLVPVLIVVLIALGLAVWMSAVRDATETGREVVTAIETRIREADLAGARTLLVDGRGDMAPALADYVEGLLELAEGRPATALTPLLRAHEARPDDPDVLDALFGALQAAGRADDALDRARAFVAAHPGDPRAHMVAAAAYFMPGTGARDPEKTLGHLQELERLIEAGGEDARPASFQPRSFFMMRAEAASEAGRHGMAMDAAGELVRVAPGDPMAHAVRGEVLRRAAEAQSRSDLYAPAAECYQVAAELDSGRWEYVHDWVQLLLLTDDPEHVAHGTRVARALARESKGEQRFQARKLLFRALMRSEELQDKIEAESLSAELVEEAPDDLEVLRNRGIFLFDWKAGGREGDFRVEAHRLLARYVELGGEVDAKLADTWGSLQKVARERPAAVLAEAAAEHLRRGRAAEAEAAYRAALEIADDDPRLHVGLLRSRIAAAAPGAEIERTAFDLYGRWPGDREVRGILCEVVERIWDLDRTRIPWAQEELAKVYERYPDDAEVGRRLALAVRAGPDTAQAGRIHERHPHIFD